MFIPYGAVMLGQQSIKSTDAQQYPYSFTNFVWWKDSDLRELLKKQVPGLGEQIAPGSASERAIHTALVHLLASKGISAEVQSVDPSPANRGLKRAEGAPPVSIQFSVASPPRITVGKVTTEGMPAGVDASIFTGMAGRPYNAQSFWVQTNQTDADLKQHGYLTSATTLTSSAPEKVDDGFVVPLAASVTAGPLFHVKAVQIDGGPLMIGRNLIPYVPIHAGDVAAVNAFSRLSNALRVEYWKSGYPDVSFDANQSLDPALALVSYSFVTSPGTHYRLRNLVIRNLSPSQEADVRKALGLKEGNSYDAYAVASLNHNLPDSLKDYDLTYSPVEDKQAGMIDLTLNFFKR